MPGEKAQLAMADAKAKEKTNGQEGEKQWVLP